jgi:hypothetical protein
MNGSGKTANQSWEVLSGLAPIMLAPKGAEMEKRPQGSSFNTLKPVDSPGNALYT